MIAIKNIEKKELVISFEGLDYIFPKDTIVLAEEKLVDHLKNIVPLAFDFDVSLPKGEPVTKVKVVKTKSYIQNRREPEQDMVVNKVDPNSEVNNSGFYGEGIEQEVI